MRDIMPRTPFRRAGKIATGVALGSTLLGLHGDVNPEHLTSRTREPIEFRQEPPSPRKMLDDPEFRQELEERNEYAKRLLRKYELKQLTGNDVRQLTSSIEESLLDIKLNSPEILQASIFDLKSTLRELKTLGEKLISSLKGAGENLWNSPDSVILAELIALATYLQLARNVSRRRSFIQGIKEARRPSFDDFAELRNPLQYPVLAALGVFVANYSHLALPIIFLNPTTRYYLGKLINRVRR